MAELFRPSLVSMVRLRTGSGSSISLPRRVLKSLWVALSIPTLTCEGLTDVHRFRHYDPLCGGRDCDDCSAWSSRRTRDGGGACGWTGACVRTIFGTNAASLVLIVLSALVIKGLLAINETAFNALKLVGACYIAYVGWDILRESRPAEQSCVAIQPRVGGFSKGFVMAISNPKDIIFFVSFFPQFINITTDPGGK